jgi:hypothetical protein
LKFVLGDVAGYKKLNIEDPNGIYDCVRNFRNIFFTLAAFLWLPASAHCQFATLPGLDFLQCSVSAQSTCAADKGCADCGGCSIEKSQYNKTGQLRVPLTDLLPLPLAPLPILAKTLPAEVSVGILTAAPPSLLQTWQFTSRTALPARAPSLAS